MEDAFALMLAGALGSDLVLVYLIGICPVIAVSRKLETAAGLAISNLIVVPFAAVLSYAIIERLPSSASSSSLKLPLIVVTIIFCLYVLANIGAYVWPKGYKWLEPFVPLMTVNCTLLGVVLLVLLEPIGAAAVFLAGFGLALGYGLLLIVFSQVRERLAAAPVPRAFRDAPIALLSLAIIGMAASGFGSPG